MAYNGYHGRCVGRLMYFLYGINHMTDGAIFGGDGENVYLHDKLYCVYTWQDDTDIPIFIFNDQKLQQHADQRVQQAIEDENAVNKMRGTHPWKLSECREYRKNRRKYMSEILKWQITGIGEKPIKPKTDPLYEEYYAGIPTEDY